MRKRLKKVEFELRAMSRDCVSSVLLISFLSTNPRKWIYNIVEGCVLRSHTTTVTMRAQDMLINENISQKQGFPENKNSESREEMTEKVREKGKTGAQISKQGK